MTVPIGRREFIATLSGTAGMAARGRAQPSTLPVMGFSTVPRTAHRAVQSFLDAFHQGPERRGYVEP
jgi:hypothetical protein